MTSITAMSPRLSDTTPSGVASLNDKITTGKSRLSGAFADSLPVLDKAQLGAVMLELGRGENIEKLAEAFDRSFSPPLSGHEKELASKALRHVSAELANCNRLSAAPMSRGEVMDLLGKLFIEQREREHNFRAEMLPLVAVITLLSYELRSQNINTHYEIEIQEQVGEIAEAVTQWALNRNKNTVLMAQDAASQLNNAITLHAYDDSAVFRLDEIIGGLGKGAASRMEQMRQAESSSTSRDDGSMEQIAHSIASMKGPLS
jgi:hypothetical protein